MSKSWRWVAAAVAVTAALLLGAERGYDYLGSPQFCNGCHYMNTKYAEWQKSTHAGVDCIVCHSGHGRLAKLMAYFKNIRFVKITLTGRLTEPVIRARDHGPARFAGCVKCHPVSELVRGEPKLAPTERVHTSHEALALNCTDCHANLVHGELRPVSPAKPSSLLCRECHRRSNVLQRAPR
jgi:nitrate/TMAO reductase-like tetraheme cytochrome c subunit